MRKSRFSEEQIIGILKERQAGIGVADLCRKVNLFPPAECANYLTAAGYDAT